jgi:diguanylate cyclase (GGDEF)-like protein
LLDIVRRRVTLPLSSLSPKLPGLLSVDEVAQVIGRHPEVVRRQARSGRLPAEKIGRGWFFKPERLAAAGFTEFMQAAQPSQAAAPNAQNSAPASQGNANTQRHVALEARSEALLAALSEAGLEALQLLDRQSIFKAVGSRLAEVDLSSFFFLLEPGGRALRVAHCHVAGPQQPSNLTPGFVLPFERVPVLEAVCQTRRPRFLGDPDDLPGRVAKAVQGDAATSRQLTDMLRLRTAISAPLVTGDRVIGAITVVGPALREADLSAVMAFANQTAAAIEAGRLLAESREAEEAMVMTLARAIELRENIQKHSAEQLELAEQFSLELGLDSQVRRRVRYTMLLQDLGKIGIPDGILKKYRRLTDEERAVMMAHPVVAAGILEQFRPLADLAPLVRGHHEWFNGEGYPDGLKGDAIPLETRIIAVINAFFRVTLDMPFRSPELMAGAIEEIKHFRGIGLDPTLVDQFLKMLERAEAENAAWFIRMKEALAQPALALRAASATNPELLSVGDSRELRIIYRIARETSAVLDLDVLLQRIVTIVREVMDYYLVSLLLPGDNPGELRLGAHAGYSTDIAGMVVPAGHGITGWVFEHGEPLIVPDVLLDSRYLKVDNNVRSEIAFPLVIRGRVIGVLNAESESVNAFGEADLALLSAVASQLASCLEVAQLHDTLKREASHDPLTRVFNRRLFVDRVQQEMARAARAKESFSLIFLDVDELKRVNDTYGHLAGDALLRQVANALTEAVRGEDLVARYGGDEFVVLLPATPPERATVVAQRIREAIGRHRFMAGGHLLAIPGISLGVASFPGDGSDPEELLAAADASLYKDKRRHAS